MKAFAALKTAVTLHRRSRGANATAGFDDDTYVLVRCLDCVLEEVDSVTAAFAFGNADGATAVAYLSPADGALVQDGDILGRDGTWWTVIGRPTFHRMPGITHYEAALRLLPRPPDALDA